MSAGHEPFLDHTGWLPDQPITGQCPLGCLFYRLSGGAYRALEAELPRLLGRPGTVGDVATLHRQRRLRHIRHIGPRRLGEIEALLVVYGFSIAPDDPPPLCEPPGPRP